MPSGFTAQELLGGPHHHPQLAGDGNKLHSLGGALEGCLGRHGMNPRRRAGFFAGGDDAADHFLELVVGRLAVCESHLGAQIIRAYKNRVHSWYAVNCFGVVHALRAFGLQDDQDLIVGGGEIFGGSAIKIQGMQPAADAAISRRRILGGSDDRTRLFHRIDHGRNNSPCACIECALDVRMRAFGDTAQRHTASLGD